MSNSEYNYFVEMDKKCKSFESKNSSKKEPVTDKDKNSKNNKQSYDFLKKNSTDIDEENQTKI
jgi:hypothetical protein